MLASLRSQLEAAQLALEILANIAADDSAPPGPEEVWEDMDADGADDADVEVEAAPAPAAPALRSAAVAALLGALRATALPSLVRSEMGM